MKKILGLFLTLMLLVVFVACKGDDTKKLLEEAKEDLTIEFTNEDDDFDSVTEDLVLKTKGKHDVTITWKSSDTNVIANDGKVTRPKYGEGDKEVTLKATLKLNDKSVEKEFILTVKEEEKPEEENEDKKAVEDVLKTIKAYMASYTKVETDFNLPVVGANDVEISWESNSDHIVVGDVVSEGTVVAKLLRPENGTGDATVKLIVTITKNDEEIKHEFTVIVAEEPPLLGGTIEEVLQLDSDTPARLDNVTVFGVIQDGYYVWDETGFLFVYTKSAPEGVKVGDIITIKGNYTIYYDQPELEEPYGLEVVGENSNPMPTPVETTIKDINNIDTKVKTYFSKYYTITGTVAIQGSHKNAYLLDEEGNKVAINYKSNDAAIKKFEGQTIIVDVVFHTYHTNDKEYRVSFIGTEEDIRLPELTEEEQLNNAYNNLVIPEEFYKHSLDLKDKMGNVDIEWTIPENDAIAQDGVVTRGATDVQVTIKAKLTIGQHTKEKEFNITVKAKDVTTLNDVFSKELDTIVDVEGIVAGVIEQGFFLYDGTASIYVFTDSAPTVKKGDFVWVTGEYYEYKEQPEIQKIIDIKVLEEAEYEMPTPELVALADLVAYAHEDNPTVYAKYVTISGVVTELQEDIYTNWYIVDGENKVMVYYKSALDEVTPFKGQSVELNVFIFRYSNGWQVAFIAGDSIEVLEISDQEKLENAKNALNIETEITDSLSLPDKIGDVLISWEVVEGTAITIDQDGNVVVTQPEAGQGDAQVTLRATLTINEETVTKDFVVTVKEIDDGISTVAEAVSAAEKTDLVVEGIVTAVYGTSGVYIQDETGAIYVYLGGDTDFREQLVVGNKVRITAKKGEFNKLPQLTGVSNVVVIEEDVQVPEVLKYDTIQDLLDDNKISYIVRLEGLTIVEVGTPNSKNQFNVTVTDGTTTIIVRVDNNYFAVAEADFFVVGATFDITAPLSIFNTSYQLMALSEELMTVHPLTDEQKAQLAHDELTIVETVKTDTYELPETVGEATVTWEVIEGTALEIDPETGVVTVIRPGIGEEDATVKLLATLTVNEVTLTKEFTVTVKAEQEGAVVLADLIISEYYEGNKGNNKYLEIYNGTGQDVDLSEYTLEIYTNGSDEAKVIKLQGTLGNGEVFVIANNQSDIQAILDAADMLSAQISHNGDDAYVLKHNGVIIDSFGRVGEVPAGGAWTANGVSTKDMVLVRKSTVTKGDTIIDDEFDPSVEWDAYDPDVFDYLGSHTIDA